ncbi:hypothetical protein [Acanthopleuribacter pedis]|uniref:Phage protein n=1 Tax=Acanthopleuribacter pedis TaxID=442870 RepID=A0A8J7U5H0_9BACT|nr:hypothetical protein [Acanthopleuribacter pedis]MBO1322548.1 hypothetical protein [Acanthopleuribacter pedis]
MKLSKHDLFALTAQGYCVVRTGTQTNCGGFAKITAAIEVAVGDALLFVWQDHPDWQGDPFHHAEVPGARIEEVLKEAVMEGVTVGFQKNGIRGGYRFTLINAGVHAVDGYPSRFRRAGFVAVVKWLENKGLLRCGGSE